MKREKEFKEYLEKNKEKIIDILKEKFNQEN